MAIRTIIETARMKQGFSTLATYLLLSIYIVGASGIARIHTHSHQREISHSEQQEKDPCHRLIYHFDSTSGCDHDSHFAASDKCDLCNHLTFHKDQVYVAVVSSSPFVFSRIDAIYLITDVDSSNTSILPSRAPPSFII